MDFPLHKKALSCLALGMLSACSQPAPETPEDLAAALIERHVDAVGGESAYADLRNVRTLVDITEQGATVRGDYRAARDGRMRIDVSFEGKRFFSEGIDEQGVWQQAGDGAPVEVVTGDAAARLRRGVAERFGSLAAIAGMAASVRLAEPQQRDGKTFDAVEIVGEDGHVRTHLFDRQTGIAARMLEREALHPDADTTQNDEEEIRSLYGERCGILQPARTRTINRETGEELQSTQMLSSRCNIPESDLDLARPQ